MANMNDERNPCSFEDVVVALKSEHEYSLRKWGYRQPDGSLKEAEHSVSDFLVYMQDYLTAAFHRASRENGNGGALDELRKVVNLGVACFMQNGIKPRENSVVINARDGWATGEKPYDDEALRTSIEAQKRAADWQGAL